MTQEGVCLYFCEATTWRWKERNAAFFVRKSLKPFSFLPVSRGWRIRLIGLKQENCCVPSSVEAAKNHFKCNKSLSYTSDRPHLFGLKSRPSVTTSFWLTFEGDAETGGKNCRAETQTPDWYFGICLVLSIIADLTPAPQPLCAGTAGSWGYGWWL